MSKIITIKKAKAALQNIRRLTPSNPKVAKVDDDMEVAVKEALFFMAPDLIRMSKRGFTNKELADGLADEGGSVKPGTLNRYINEYLLESKKDSEKTKSASKADDSNEEKTESEGQPGVSGEAGGHGGLSKLKPSGTTQNQIPAPENPESVPEHPNRDEKETGEKSDGSVAHNQYGVRMDV